MNQQEFDDLREEVGRLRREDRNVEALRTELSELKDGTDGLGNQVGSLSHALAQLNTLQLAQRGLQRVVADVQTTSVTRDEADLAKQDTMRRLLSYRRRTLSTLIASFTIAGLIMLAVLVGALDYANRTRTESKALKMHLYSNCQVRSQQALAVRDFADREAALDGNETVDNGAKRTAILRDLAKGFGTAPNCAALLG